MNDIIRESTNGIERARERRAKRDASGEAYVEGSIYKGMEACVTRFGRTIAHVPRYADAVEIAAALSPPTSGDSSVERLREAIRLLRSIPLHRLDVSARDEVRAFLALSPAVSSGVGEGERLPCDRCQGNGEVVTDWGRYLHSNPGDAGDEAVADCPDCDGQGYASTPHTPDGGAMVEALRTARSAINRACLELQEVWGAEEGDDASLLDALTKIDAALSGAN